MSNELNVGDLAIVIPGKGANNVRQKPNIKSHLVKAKKEESQIPEHAVLAILPSPAGWTGAYPHTDGVHVWWYVRGRTDKTLAADQFEVIEGWTAANEKSVAFLLKMGTRYLYRLLHPQSPAKHGGSDEQKCYPNPHREKRRGSPGTRLY